MRILKDERGKRRVSKSCDVRKTWPLMVLELEGPMSQGVWAASRRWKRQENRFSCRISRKKCGPADTLILGKWDLFWTSDLQNCKHFSEATVCGNWLQHNDKWIQNMTISSLPLISFTWILKSTRAPHFSNRDNDTNCEGLLLGFGEITVCELQS